MQNTRDNNPDPRCTAQDPSSLNNSNSDNLLYYLEVLVRNWRMITKVTIVAFILSVIISLCLPNIFRSTAKILPPQQDSSGLMGLLVGASGMGGMAADLLGKGTPADLYVGILNSDTISDKIIDRFKLMDVYEQKYRVATYKVLGNNVSISVGKKDGIIAISVNDKDAKRAAEIANAYVDELGKLTAKLSITGAVQNRLFYYERLSKAKIDLTNAEDALKSFQRKYKALDITEQAKGTIKGVADLEAQLAMEEVKLAGLRQTLTDGAQEVKSQTAVITNIKTQIAKFEGNRTGAAIPGVSSVPELGQKYLRLMREFKIQETIVELLTKQYEMAKLSEAKDSSSIQLIQEARVSDVKSKPKRSLIVLATTIAAVFGAVLFAFIREVGQRMSEENRERWERIISLLPHIRGFRFRHRAISENNG